MRPTGATTAPASSAHSRAASRGRSTRPRREAAGIRAWVLCAVLAAVAPVHAGDRIAYDIDPVHTRVLLAVDHAGFSKALGTVSGSTGRLWFDEDDWSSAAVAVVVPIARLDFGDAKWNTATLARNLLDAERYPDARFVSTRIEPLDAGRARVHGTLTLHGVSREVALEAVLNAAKRHPLPPFRRTVGFSATAMLSRSAFGVDAWPSVIGDAVELRIELEATRSRDQADQATTSQPAQDTADADAPASTTPDPAQPDPAQPDPAPPDPAPPDATSPDADHIGRDPSKPDTSTDTPTAPQDPRS